MLIALSISAVTNPLAELVLKKLDELRGSDAHFSVILSEEDSKLYKRLGIHVSCEPRYEVKKLYQVKMRTHPPDLKVRRMCFCQLPLYFLLVAKPPLDVPLRALFSSKTAFTCR